MRRVISALLLLILFIFGSLNYAISGSIKIAVITDIHFLSSKLTTKGSALSAYENATGRNINDLHAVLDSVLTDLLENDVDILLITGDISNHGEQQSHIDFIEKLTPLRKAGVRIFVTPGNHDINTPDAKAYIGDNASLVESVTAEDFVQLYEPFGYGSSLRRDNGSLSYLAEIDAKSWLLSIDTNRYDEHTTSSITGGRIRHETMEWALQILHEAKLKGIRVIGMMHHGLVEHMLFQNAFFSDYLVEDWQNKANTFADAGLNVVFTGHFHSNDITLHTSPSGNYIYDIETASLAQFPFAYRIMNLTDSTLSIDTHFITSVSINPHLEKEYYKKLENITRRGAVSKINNLGMPMPPQVKDVLVDMIVKLNMAHVKGDEVADREMLEIIESFEHMMGNEVQKEDYTFDFPPEDNKLIIEFQTQDRR